MLLLDWRLVHLGQPDKFRMSSFWVWNLHSFTVISVWSPTPMGCLGTPDTKRKFLHRGLVLVANFAFIDEQDACS